MGWKLDGSLFPGGGGGGGGGELDSLRRKLHYYGEGLGGSFPCALPPWINPCKVKYLL